MRDYRNSKAMAQTLRDTLSDKKISLTQSESLELIARAFGLKDWNTLAARIAAAESDAPVPSRANRHKKPISKPFTRAIVLPVVLMRDVVVFPNTTMPLTAGRERTIHALEHAIKSDGRILLVAQKVPTDENPKSAGVYEMGVVGTVLQSVASHDGLLMSHVEGHQRAKIVSLSVGDQFYEAEVTPAEEDRGDDEKTRSLSQKVYEEIQALAKASSANWAVFLRRTSYDNDPGRLADTIASRLPSGVGEKQQLLETTNVARRLEMVLALAKLKGQQAA